MTQPIRLKDRNIAIMKRVTTIYTTYLTYLTPDMKNKLLITAAITIYTFYIIMLYM